MVDVPRAIGGKMSYKEEIDDFWKWASKVVENELVVRVEIGRDFRIQGPAEPFMFTKVTAYTYDPFSNKYGLLSCILREARRSESWFEPELKISGFKDIGDLVSAVHGLKFGWGDAWYAKSTFIGTAWRQVRGDPMVHIQPVSESSFRVYGVINCLLGLISTSVRPMSIDHVDLSVEAHLLRCFLLRLAGLVRSREHHMEQTARNLLSS